MKTKIQIKSVLGGLLFEFEKENNSVKDTVVEARLRQADLRRANLRKEDLRQADLRGADLRGADLRWANLYGANLYGANLYGADLYGADLYGADLREADLRGADLRGADLRGANLRGANLCEADLRGADLRGAKNSEMVQALTVIVPEGDIIGWKLCRDKKLVKLLIPKEAKRSNGTGRKCRAEYAEVLEIIDLAKPTNIVSVAYSQHAELFMYQLGEKVVCDKWNEDRFEECSGGIHFFITRLEAENYV